MNDWQIVAQIETSTLKMNFKKLWMNKTKEISSLITENSQLLVREGIN